MLSLPDRPVWADSASRRPENDSPASRLMPNVEIVDLRQELKAGRRGFLAVSHQCLGRDRQLRPASSAVPKSTRERNSSHLS